jgi:hypothetical protein
VANHSTSIGLAAVAAFALLAAPACTSSGPQCIVAGTEHPVGQPFTLLGCGSCTCDSFGDVKCENAECSTGHMGDGAAGATGAEAGADASSGDGSDLATSD